MHVSFQSQERGTWGGEKHALRWNEDVDKKNADQSDN